jgi:hypothetical protein
MSFAVLYDLSQLFFAFINLYVGRNVLELPS